MALKQEMEVAMKLLEKDTHEKQDTLAALRLQLDQVKTLNVQMFHKAQVAAHNMFSFSYTLAHLTLSSKTNVALKDSERAAEKKQAEAVKLEQKMDVMGKTMEELELRCVFVHCMSLSVLDSLSTRPSSWLRVTDYRTRSASANRAMSRTKT